ncbi:MAG: MBL fold metallo-hydrolase [Bacteroidia bacterium]|nr:MBL fold metallo-hydrolase [Bacteroidia bacterium]
MKFQLLGTGTSQGIPVIGCHCEVCQSKDYRDKRLRTAAVFMDSYGHNIAIDCGPDFRQQMLRARINELEGILITHTHNDHIVGLDDVRPFNFSMKRSIPLYGLEQHLEEIRSRFTYVFEDNPYPGAPKIDLIPISPYKPLAIQGIQILPILVWHGDLEVLGFRIGNYAYITDTNRIPERSIAELRDLDILILDSLHHKKHHSHFNFEQSITVAQRIGARRTFLIHISHHMGLHQSIDRRCPENIHLGFDGMILEN